MKQVNMKLSIRDTQVAIKEIKTKFEANLSHNLHLLRVSAPKFIRTNTGVQDDLANTCASVKFHVPSCQYDVEIVHSLAKWKRIALGKYQITEHEGIYTDMDAIRKDEIVDFMHSIYVDQWDWEVNIHRRDRTEETLRQTVNKIYEALKSVDRYIDEKYHRTTGKLPLEIHFIHSEELEELYPTLTPKERENVITKEYGAVFLIGIGYPLNNGQPHDIRAVDYDDWSSPNGPFHGLNGDILVWNDVTQCAFELSSMGIRVDGQALTIQSELMHQPTNTSYHQMIYRGDIPFSIGGGIGQSRLCMYLLEKHHIGEVQVSEWPVQMCDACLRQGIYLL
jgi:aspartate--ammonia ligase